MEALIFMFVAALFLVVPVTALVLAIVNRNRTNRLEQRLFSLEMESAARRRHAEEPRPQPKPAPEPELPLPVPEEQPVVAVYPE